MQSQDILQDLECPVCLNYLSAPIKQCVNGHCICGSCASRVLQSNCPLCMSTFVKTKCLILEKILSKMVFPCVNRSEGCPVSATSEDMKKHVIVCRWKLQFCPIIHFGLSCAWKGRWIDLPSHLFSNHKRFVWDQKNNTKIPLLEMNNMFITLDYNNIFFYYCRTSGDNHHCSMFLLGNEEEAMRFKYTITMTADNGVDGISETRVVRSVTDTVEGICKPCKCIQIDNHIIQNVIKNNGITIQISEI